MMKFLRQLLGCSRRAAEADRMLAENIAHFRTVNANTKAQVDVIERLVGELKRDLNKWGK